MLERKANAMRAFDAGYTQQMRAIAMSNAQTQQNATKF